MMFHAALLRGTQSATRALRSYDAAVVALAASCPQLESVIGYFNFTIDGATFTGESELTDAIVAQVMLRPEAAELKSMDLEDCELITDVSIIAIVEGCPQLKSVNLTRCSLLTDVSVGALAVCRPRLESVTIDDCELITDASVAVLKAALPDASVIAMISV